MKKFFVFAAILLSLVTYFGYTGYGIRIGEFTWSLAPDRQLIYDNNRRFLEDIQYKDFAHASTFHTEEDRKKKDLPKLLEEKFLVKPELLDIRSFEILQVELHSSGDRARVKTKTTAKILNSEQSSGKEDVKNIESLWYWKKLGSKWFMDLSSSL